MENPYYLSDVQLQKLADPKSYTNFVFKPDSKEVNNAGIRISDEISNMIATYIENDISREELFSNIKDIFAREWEQNPKLMWELYGTSSRTLISRHLAKFAQDISESSKPEDYLEVLMPGILLIDMKDKKEKEWTPELLSTSILFITKHQSSDNTYIVEPKSYAIERISEIKKIEDPAGKIPANIDSIIEQLKTDYRIMSIVSEKETYDPKKLGLTAEAIKAFYDLAMSGDGATADRPDEPPERDNTIDYNFAEFVAMYTHLEKTDPDAYKTMMNCMINGSDLRSMIPSLQKGSCAGTFKREVAKFLYEEVGISSEMQQELKKQYYSTLQGKEANSSKLWVQKSDKILVNHINSHLDNSKGEAIDPQLIELAQKNLHIIEKDLIQAIKQIKEINSALGQIPPLKEKKSKFSFFQKVMEVNNDFSINLEKLKISVTVLKSIVNDINEFQEHDSFKQIAQTQPDLHDKFKKLLQIAAEGYEKLSEGANKLSIDLSKKDSKEFQSQIKQDLESLKNTTYFAGLEVRSMTEKSSLQFH